jgi:hypothetical protein
MAVFVQLSENELSHHSVRIWGEEIWGKNGKMSGGGW